MHEVKFGVICSVYNFDFAIGDNGFLGAVAVTVGAGPLFGSSIRLAAQPGRERAATVS